MLSGGIYMDEKKVGVLIRVSAGTFFNMKLYNIFVTDKRLLFSHITKSANKETEKRLDELVKGKSFKERLSIIANHKYELPERYETMTYEAILQEHENNFSIDLDDIIKVKVKRPKTTDSKGWHKDDYLIIKTNEKKLRVNTSSIEDLKVLNLVLGDRAKIPKIIF
jgi:hypothetical protein